jgi:hypothetical protein
MYPLHVRNEQCRPDDRIHERSGLFSPFCMGEALVDVARYAWNNLVLQCILLENFSKLIPHMHIQEVDAKEVLY